MKCRMFILSQQWRRKAYRALRLRRPRQPVRPRYSGHRWNNRSLDYFLEQRWKIHGSMSAVSLEFRPPYCFCSLRLKFMPVTRIFWGTAVAQWLRCCATNRKVAGSIPAGVSGFFVDIKSFRSHYGPGVDSASNRYEYQEYFLGERGPVRKADNLTTTCAVVMISGNLNFLEPLGHSRPVTGQLYL